MCVKQGVEYALSPRDVVPPLYSGRAAKQATSQIDGMPKQDMDETRRDETRKSTRRRWSFDGALGPGARGYLYGEHAGSWDGNEVAATPVGLGFGLGRGAPRSIGSLTSLAPKLVSGHRGGGGADRGGGGNVERRRGQARAGFACEKRKRGRGGDACSNLGGRGRCKTTMSEVN